MSESRKDDGPVGGDGGLPPGGPPSDPTPVRWAVGLYRILLLGLPGDLREVHGADMVRDVEQILLDAWRRSGSRGVAAALLRSLMDLAAGIGRTHWRELEAGSASAWSRPGPGERMMNVIRELRLATRSLARRPGFAATAVLTLGLGIGSVVAIFTFVNSILLQPLPYPESDRIVEISAQPFDNCIFAQRLRRDDEPLCCIAELLLSMDAASLHQRQELVGTELRWVAVGQRLHGHLVAERGALRVAQLCNLHNRGGRS